MDPTHPHNQIENASAPLRLCARTPVPDGDRVLHPGVRKMASMGSCPAVHSSNWWRTLVGCRHHLASRPQSGV